MPEKTLSIKIRHAARANDFQTFVRLVNEDISQLNVITRPFGSWLHMAASFGRVDMVKYLLELGADINLKERIFDGNALNLAASKGHTEVVLLLLENGAEMDVSQPERNPLFGAIYGGSKEIVEILIKQGIDYRIRYTGKRMTDMGAIEFARERGQTEILNYLESLK